MKNFLAILVLFVCSSQLCALESEFSRDVNIAPLGDKVAVFTDGRVKSFETFTRSYMPFISGSKTIDGQTISFTYLDMMFRPDHYINKDIIYGMGSASMLWLSIGEFITKIKVPSNIIYIF